MASQHYEFTPSNTPYFTEGSLPPSSSYIDTSKPEHHGATGMPYKPIHRDTTALGKSAYTLPYKLSMLEQYTSDVYVVPVIVLGIHTLLLIFSWSFYASVMKRPKALNPTLAVIAQACPQSVTYITTMICSMINLTAITLYKKSVRYSISRFLSSRVSLYALAASNRLAQMQIIDNFKRPAWTIAALLAILANMGQIAGYTTLLQPKRIEIKFDITGFELDLRSANFQALMESNAQLFTPRLFERACHLRSTRFYLPSIFNFNQFSYFNSTKGILPIATQRVDSSVRSARENTLPINAVVHQTQRTPSGFPVRFMMTQQGFTGDVKCEKRDLNSTTSPSVNVASIQDDLFGAPATLARLEVSCPGQTARKFSPSVLTSKNIDALFTLCCEATESWKTRGYRVNTVVID